MELETLNSNRKGQRAINLCIWHTPEKHALCFVRFYGVDEFLPTVTATSQRKGCDLSAWL